ncbi:MAG: tetratricopeptide repeat protein [Paludibacteraceae bacterium]|nr:tetratricopeptide repeat protein [Paludibacteraceae bacterium]
MKRLASLLLVLLAVCSSLFAQFTEADKPLFNAYLENNMQRWKNYIDATNWEKSDTQQRLRLIAYEYGYCAATLDVSKKQAAPYVERFRSHVEEMQSKMSAGHYDMYMSSVYAFEIMMGKSAHFISTLKLATSAAEKNPTNPITLGYKANVLFYAPRGIGNKKEALEIFKKCEKLYQAPQWKYCWNRPATLLTIAQCYEKQGDLETALQKTNALLKEFPNYKYVRETYLPQLKAKIAKQKK